ncbi:MAG: SDR family oxidoreductase [Actinobacteria bacterium]|nr:SDR family oxidoreductase [Actinomycetota bacterium]
MKLDGKVAVITGAGSGIGRATALLFAQEGARVVVADLAVDGGEETVRLIAAQGGRSSFIRTDVASAESVANLINGTISRYERLDIIFNNAGIDLAHPVTETSEEVWDKTIAVNLKGVFLGCKYAIHQMIKNGGGSIVNTASVLALVASPNQAAYCASKGGVLALTRQIAFDYARYNIRANCICPGDVLTPMQQRFLAESKDPQATLESLSRRYPMGRFANPEEIACAALYLASDDSSFVTGVALPVDGGLTAW